MPMVKVPLGTDALHPDAAEGWQHPLHPASVKNEWPVPESPLIGRTCTVHCWVHNHYDGAHWYEGPATILRVHGNKRERMRTPELCSPDQLKDSVSCTVALHEPDGTLGKSTNLYVGYADIAPLESQRHAT